MDNVGVEKGICNMGDMGEVFREMKVHAKKQRIKNYKKNIPQLKELGAVEKSAGVWRLGDIDFYPKGWARNYKTGEKYSFLSALNKVKDM